MDDTQVEAAGDDLVWQEMHTFRCALPIQVRLQEIVRAMGRTEDLACLEVGAVNGAFTQQLRRRGGSWQSLATDQASADRVASVLGEDVAVLDKDLPFDDKSFDLVVVNAVLERYSDDIEFIEECHRVLKPDGRVIVHVTRIKPYSLVRALRSAFGVTPEKRGHVRPGYTEPQMFDVLKSGFDVLHMKSYSRFFTEVVDVFVDRMVYGREGANISVERYPRRAFSIGSFFYRVADQFDMLLLFSRGHRLLAIGKRRGWRPRDAPILVDGRSISEAVLSKALQ